MYPQTPRDRGAAPLLWVLCNASPSYRAQHTKFGNSYGYGLEFVNWKVQHIRCLNTNHYCFTLLILTRVMKALSAALGARYFRWLFICIPHKYAGRINACHLKYTVASFFEPLGCQEHFGRLFKINMVVFSSELLLDLFILSTWSSYAEAEQLR